MGVSERSVDQQEAFSDYVASCHFFDADGYLDLEKLCMHLYLALFCDNVQAPEPVALYEVMLRVVGGMKDKIDHHRVFKTAVENWSEDMRAYYPDKEKTCIHFEVMGTVYPYWIENIGAQLMGMKKGKGDRGRFWVRRDWLLTSMYLQRFEAELVRLAGLSAVVADDSARLN